jgi:hypothetical protein
MSFAVCGYAGVSSRLCSRLVARRRGCLQIGSFLAVLFDELVRGIHAHIHLVMPRVGSVRFLPELWEP